MNKFPDDLPKSTTWSRLSPDDSSSLSLSSSPRRRRGRKLTRRFVCDRWNTFVDVTKKNCSYRGEIGVVEALLRYGVPLILGHAVSIHPHVYIYIRVFIYLNFSLHVHYMQSCVERFIDQKLIQSESMLEMYKLCQISFMTRYMGFNSNIHMYNSML